MILTAITGSNTSNGTNYLIIATNPYKPLFNITKQIQNVKPDPI